MLYHSPSPTSGQGLDWTRSSWMPCQPARSPSALSRGVEARRVVATLRPSAKREASRRPARWPAGTFGGLAPIERWGGVQEKEAGRLLDGRVWDEYPDRRVPALIGSGGR